MTSAQPKLTLAKTDATLLFLLFAFAFGIRVLYLFDLRSYPYFDYIVPAFDHINFDVAATNFAKGDLLAHATNNKYAPLYKYFLGVIYWLCGRNFYVVYSIQFAMGALASVLVYLIARDLFGTRAAIFAFLGFALHSTEIIYEGIILREAFVTFWGIVSLFLLSRLQTAWSTGKLVLAALALSFFIQSRPNSILCLPFVCFYLHKNVFHGLDAGDRLKFWLIFSGTILGSFAPMLVQCYLVHGHFVFFDGAGPDALVSGNLTGYSGVGFDSDLYEAAQKDIVPGFAAEIRYLLHHMVADPIGYLKLYLRKIYYFFNDFETPTNTSVYLYREHSPVLRGLLNHFAIFSSLGLAGIVLAVKNGKKAFLLYTYVLLLTLAVILVNIVDRYRLPAVPYYVIFSGYTLDAILSWIEQKKYRNAVAVSLICGGLFYGFMDTRGLVRIRDIDYANLASAYMVKKDFKETRRYLDDAAGIYPQSPWVLYYTGLYHYLQQEWESAVFYFTQVAGMAGKTGKFGELGDGATQLLPEIFLQQAKAAIERQDYVQAADRLEAVLLYKPGSAEFLTYLCEVYYNMGRVKEARDCVLRALSINPDHSSAQRLLMILDNTAAPNAVLR
jgi:hypothetical protein